MDTNDYKEGQKNGQPDQNNQSQNNQSQYNQNQYTQNQYTQNQNNPYGYGQQPNYQGYYGYYGGAYPGGQNTGKAPKKKGNGAVKAAVAIIMIICLIGGIILGVVFYPSLFGKTQNLTMGTGTQKSAAPQVSNGGAGSLTTNQPSIGGAAPTFDSSDDRIVQIAKKLSPSVVFIGINYKTASGFGKGGDTTPKASDEPKTSGEVFNAGGTGIIVSANGYIVTNNHVVEGADTIKVKLVDGTEYNAQVVGLNVKNDIAVIKINASGLSPASLGDSDKLQVGETVVAIGTPVDQSLQGTVTSGIVSALNRQIDITNDDGTTMTHSFLQTDAAINPGNSGGPLINMSGQVIGINAGKITTAEIDPYTGQQISAEGIGFAIPINSAIPVIQQLETNGRVGIGVTCTVDSSNKYNPSGSPSGVTVISVTEGGPAAAAGIKAGDIITVADGKELKSVEDMLIIIQGHKVGDILKLTVWRSGQTSDINVTVGDLNQMSK